MNDVSHIDTIAESIDSSNHVNYKNMIWEAIDAIEESGGEKWSNYNSSDPGRTILDILCFALLDLGYKSDFPIEDLFSGKDGKIQTADKLYTAREVLFTNPVTLPDFRRLLIDRSDAIKNCWIEPASKKLFQGSFQTYYELCDELKISFLKKHLQTSSGKATDPFSEELTKLWRGINGLLYQHRNLGDLFLKPIMLTPVSWNVKGKFYFNSGIDIESEIANIYYQLNDFWSAYIHFHTYEELKEQGKSVDQILNGPRLDNGFILDEDLKPLTRCFDLKELKSSLTEVENLSNVFSFGIDALNVKSANGKIAIPSGTSPFFDYTRASEVIQNTKELQFYNGDQLVRRVDQAKVNTYYNLLADRKAIGGNVFPNDLGPELPKGKHRKIKSYHSPQYLFSQQFGLNVDRSFEGVSASEKGRIKQLKAYLMLFEQLIADHQAQLAHAGELLSFDSGVKVGKGLCKTYYSQGLYKAPGARFILKAFDNYKRDNQYLREHPEKTWELFKKDKSNVYESFLENHKNKVDKNIDRKSKIMEHLLSRHGEKYDESCAPILNPHYGNYSLAKVEIISSLLRKFPVYSENIGRSYFNQSKQEEAKELNLFSGLELRLELLFQLTAYYQEIIDLVRENLKKIESEMNMEIYPERTAEGHMIVVKYQKEEILRMPFIKDTLHETILYHLDVLQRLCDETKGFVLIDHQLLITNLQGCKWNVIRKEQVQEFKSGGKRIMDFTMQTAIHLANKYETVWIEDDVHIRLSATSRKIRKFPVEKLHSNHPVFRPSSSIFLPSWVSKLRDPAFHELFKNKCFREGPVYLDFSFHRIPANLMEDLLTVRETWLEDLKAIQEGNAGSSVSKSYMGSVANGILLDLILQSQKRSTPE
ncbi:MAG: hypothetical protein ABJG47_00795 [Ekhidna sp.]